MSEKKELKKLSETFNDISNTIDKIGDNIGAYMWILPGVLFVIFCILVKIDYYKFYLPMIIQLLLLGSTAFIFYYTKTHITVIESLKDNYSNFFVNKWFPQYMFENDKKNKNNNTSKVSNIVVSVIYYCITNPLILQWFIRIERYIIIKSIIIKSIYC